MERLSADAFSCYRTRIYDNPDILPYFEQATPVEELAHARIGSRPARRIQSRGLEDLRALPSTPGSAMGWDVHKAHARR